VSDPTTDLNVATALLLGLIQGLTEFLPVSSSGHLVITQKLLGLPGDSTEMLLFDVMSHLGTLAAVLYVFAPTFRLYVSRLVSELKPGYTGRRSAMLVSILGVVACIPTGVIGIGFKDEFEEQFANVGTTGFALLVTGTLLFVIGRTPRPRRGWRRFGWWRAALVGVAQGMAILPGISRSGTTICVAQWLGLKRRWSAEFSFFIAAPVIAGAGLLKLRETFELPADQLATISWGPIIAGSLCAAVSGAAALRLLVKLVVADKLSYFSYYCWLVGLATLVWRFGF
jgi:undecaprenyl-diphosphatase